MAGKGPIYITSDSQDYNQLTGRMDASGNVKIKYQDTTGSGPKVVMIRNADGQAEKVVFVGRSQITQAGKRWIADKIVMMVEDRKILAEGNTKAFILPKKQDDGTANGFQLAQREQAKRSAAAQASSPSSQISTTRIDNAQ
jgi:OstA-like protein.